MQRGNLDDLLAFVAVARERSFTKAAAKLGVSQSALSHTIRGLEARLGVRLLTRTTRSVAPTAAGERLLDTVGPRFEEIEAELEALSDFRDKPAGTIRITAGDHAVNSILWPKLARFLPKYPDIKVEIVVDYGLADIVAQRYDAGVRFGEQVAKDMIAVRVGPDVRFALVGAKSYFSQTTAPQDAAGSGRPCLHQSAPPDPRRIVRLGVRARRPRAESARRRPTRLQWRLPGAQCCHCRFRARLPAGGPGAAAHREGPAQAGPRRMVPGLAGISPLLPEPAPAVGGLRACWSMRCATAAASSSLVR